MSKYLIPSEHALSRRWPCSVCGDDTRPKDQMVAKRVVFTTLGAGYDTLRSRTTEYLCPPCRDRDPIWNSPAHAGPARKERPSAEE